MNWRNNSCKIVLKYGRSNKQSVVIILLIWSNNYSISLRFTCKMRSTLLCIPVYIVKKETRKFEQKGTGSPGTFEKSPGTLGLLWSRDQGTTGPSRFSGFRPVLSRDHPGTSRDGKVLLESLICTRPYCFKLDFCLRNLDLHISQKNWNLVCILFSFCRNVDNVFCFHFPKTYVMNKPNFSDQTLYFRKIYIEI